MPLTKNDAGPALPKPPPRTPPGEMDTGVDMGVFVAGLLFDPLSPRLVAIFR